MHSLSVFYLFKIFTYFKKHTDKTNSEVEKKKYFVTHILNFC